MAERDVLEEESYSETVYERVRDPYEVGNDEYPDYACHPCGKSGKIETATKFCIECGYLMCSTCLDQHNKFDFMKGHQITTAEASTNFHIAAKFVKDCPIKSSVDTKVACITDACLMDDGNIILADLNNRVIKKLGANFQLEDKCTLKIPGIPAAICQTKYPEVAIALLSNKSIQFANVSSPMSLTKSFSIKEACRGIAFSNAALYLACGGMVREFSDGPGEIRVYDQSGNLSRKYTTICGKRCSVPKRIAATSSDVFIADKDGGVFGLGVNGGGEKGPFTHRDMVSPIGLCGLTHGVLIVCGYESHNVMLLYEKDGSMKPLIGIDQGLHHPKSVCLDSTGKKLLVAMSDVGYIKVFDLIRK